MQTLRNSLMSYVSQLRCGPLVRYVDTNNAVIWVEVDSNYELELEIAPEAFASTGAATLIRSRPVQIHDSYYVWIACPNLLPNTWYSYRIFCVSNSGKRQLWPDARLSGTCLPSVFRTFPIGSAEPLRICFGSCRAGMPPNDSLATKEGLDALLLYAKYLMMNSDARNRIWPLAFLFIGDQIYADCPHSSAIEAVFERSKAGLPYKKCDVCGKGRCSPGPRESTRPASPLNFEQYAMIYREAWTVTPMVRWVLSCIPSFMIFDDHDIIDDWNISDEWVQAAKTPGWQRRIAGGLLAYWIYQGSGNLAPKQWYGDLRMQPVISLRGSISPNATTHFELIFNSLVRQSIRAQWSYTIDIGDTRFVIGDTRMSRKLTDHRLLIDDQAWDNFVALAKDSRCSKIFLVTPGPILSPHPLHDALSRVAESIEGYSTSKAGGLLGAISGYLLNMSVGGVIGALAGYFGPDVVLDYYRPSLLQEFDAELWPVFPTSFNWMLRLLEDLADGIGTTRKRFIGLIGGDVHHSHVIRGDLLKTQRPKSVISFTSSPIRRSVSSGDKKKLRWLSGSSFAIRKLLATERPSFVNKQMQHLDWYPIRLNGSKPKDSDVDEWDHYGQFLTEIEIQPHKIEYRYLRALGSGVAQKLDVLGGDQIIAI